MVAVVIVVVVVVAVVVVVVVAVVVEALNPVVVKTSNHPGRVARKVVRGVASARGVARVPDAGVVQPVSVWDAVNRLSLQ